MKRRDKSQNCWLCQLLVALLGRLVLQKWNSCAALVQVGSQAKVRLERTDWTWVASLN